MGAANMVTDRTYKFSGHQTFVFRYGWLEKGVRGVAERPTLFSDDDALVRLGVGKNMVASIRHWCQIAQLIEADKNVDGNTGRFLRVSDIGGRLLLNGGWDPYLEDDASLWLIHWLLVSNPDVGTSWQLLFSRFNRPDFTRRELVDFIASFVDKQSLKLSENVIARDTECLIRTYSAGASGKTETSAEETFDCPLLQLDLVQPSPDGELYRFSIGPKTSLPAAVFAFALAQYFDRTAGTTKTLNVQKCLYGEGSPGQAFKLDENSLIEYIEELGELTGHAMILDETAGLKQIYRKQAFDPMQVLNDYYRSGAGK
jgi:hypothetical protein